MERIEKGKVLKAEDLLPMKAGHTISKAIDDHFVLFSLAEDTDISPETYLEDKSYFVFKGEADVVGQHLKQGDFIVIKSETLLGIETTGGAYILEGTWKGDEDMKLEKGVVLSLKDQVEIVEGGIANMDIAKREGMKFALLAFDKSGLTPHSAPRRPCHRTRRSCPFDYG